METVAATVAESAPKTNSAPATQTAAVTEKAIGVPQGSAVGAVKTAGVEGLEVSKVANDPPQIGQEITVGVEVFDETIVNTAEKIKYYEVNGFKFNEYYYDRLWANGRQCPGFRAESILNGATQIIPDPKGYEGFYKYICDEWEMIYNPTTKVVSHLSKFKR